MYQIIPVINNHWQTQPITITDKTTTKLSNGNTIPTALNMYRQALKI